MIAFLVTVYAAVVLTLFKLKLVKPRPYPIAMVILAGILMIGGVVVVAWMQYAPISGNLVTTQYVVQLVPYNVKGYVKKVYAKANEPLKKGDLLLEIDPAPYQYTVNQIDAQLNAAKANVKQSQAALEAADANATKAKDGVQQAEAAVDQAKGALANAQAALEKWKAADELAKTQEKMAINLQRTGVGAISLLKGR